MEESNVDSTQVEQKPATEEQPAWKKAINLVAIIAIGVAGLFSLIFMSLVGYALVTDGESQSMGLIELFKYLATTIQANNGAFSAIIGVVMSTIVVIFIKVAAIVVAIVCFIKMLIQFIRLWSHKENSAEYVSVSTSLLYISFAILVLVAGTIENEITPEMSIVYTYDSSTKAGLAIVSVLFGVYACCKIAIAIINLIKNKSKNQILNSAFALGAAILSAVLLILIASSGAGYKADTDKYIFGYNNLMWSNLATVITSKGKSTEAIVSMICALVCFVFQFILIFNTGKLFHASLNSSYDGKKKVDINSVIGLLVISILYTIASIVLTNQNFKSSLASGATMELTNTIMLVVMTVLLLAVAIVNKVLVKDEATAQPAQQPANN